MILAGLIGGAVLATSAFNIYIYTRSQDPLNPCNIADPEPPPFNLSIPITVLEDGFPALVPKGVGYQRWAYTARAYSCRKRGSSIIKQTI